MPKLAQILKVPRNSRLPFTERGIEILKEFIADIRTWEGGVRQFVIDEQCDPEKFERIMADESKS